jgi:hypothetical protein
MTSPEFPNTWSTPVSAVVAVATGGVVLAVFAAALTTDAAGRIIVGCAAAALLGFAVLAGVRRPRLALVADHDEFRLTVRDLRGTTSYGPADIIGVRLGRGRRVGRASAMLEIDVRDRDADRLLVFTRWDLGTNPLNVLDALTAAGLTR